MDNEVSIGFEQRFRPLKEMSRSEVEDELQIRRNIWTWLDEDTQRILTMVGKQVRLLTRNNQRYMGRLGAPSFRLEKVEIECDETVFDYNKGLKYVERKVIIIPFCNVYQLEEIIYQEEHPIETPSLDKVYATEPDFLE